MPAKMGKERRTGFEGRVWIEGGKGDGCERFALNDLGVA
jgi:hypothetical protein